MKQSYSLTIADMALDITTDASTEELESIVGLLDRRIREILLKSRRCSKSEAVLVCALGLCAEKMALAEENRTLMQNATLDQAKIESLGQRIRALEASLAAATKPASLIDAAGNTPADAATSGENAANNTAEPADPSAEASTDAAPEAKATAADSLSDPFPFAVSAERSSGKNKNRTKVGSMFDLLTFTDI